MKKILLCLFVFALSACTLNVKNTPKDVVKEFLDKYKNQDNEVINDLDNTISNEYVGEYKDRYKKIMVNQYKNMEYKIVDEVIDGNTAVVVADITVYDYSNAISKSNTYLSEHSNEFSTNEENNTENENDALDSTNTNNNLDNDKFLEYKLGLLENVKDRKTYTIEFSLNKNNENKKWVLDSLTNQDIEKIHGLYQE
ncbi:MAG: hypothetical protein IIZ67_02245 [Bacilli bacterium]|nr:hypothetical protein [Bacilli bacterium]